MSKARNLADIVSDGVLETTATGVDVTGDMNIGNGTLFVDASTNNVGIGTASPTEKLDVNGTVKATAFVGDGSGLTGVSKGLGDGQTWQNVTGSRAANVVYTNTTGRSIYISAGDTAGPSRAILTVDGVQVQTNGEASTNGNAFSGVGAVIPNGSTYQITFASGAITYWAELR